MSKRARFVADEEEATEAAARKLQQREKKKKEKHTEPRREGAFFVAFGSYERLLYGIDCEYKNGEVATKVEFSFPAHLSSIRSCTMTHKSSSTEGKGGSKTLLTGGSDETIKVWDLRRKREVGILEGFQTGIIGSMTYVEHRGVLLGASTDGTISMYRARDWVFLRSLKGHIGRVNSVTAHPAGRVALSVGQDKMLRLWDIVAGKAVSALRLPGEGDVVVWSVDGASVAVVCQSSVAIFNVDMSLAHRIAHRRRVNDVQFVIYNEKRYLLLASEDGSLYIYDISDVQDAAEGSEDALEQDWAIPYREPKLAATVKAHEMRVKAVRSVIVQGAVLVVTISSDGWVKMYDLDKVLSGDHDPVGSFDTDKSRLTCVAVGVISG